MREERGKEGRGREGGGKGEGERGRGEERGRERRKDCATQEAGTTPHFLLNLLYCINTLLSLHLLSFLIVLYRNNRAEQEESEEEEEEEEEQCILHKQREEMSSAAVDWYGYIPFLSSPLLTSLQYISSTMEYKTNIILCILSI